FAVTLSARSSAGQDEEVLLIEKAKIGGSADTEITDVAVKPTGRSPSSNVTTATPAGCCRNTAVNSSRARGVGVMRWVPPGGGGRRGVPGTPDAACRNTAVNYSRARGV